MFRYDGSRVPNSKVVGHWSVVSEVAEPADFDPSRRLRKPNRPPFSRITFLDNSTTNETTWIWSGDTLMDFNRYQALRMTPQTLAGTEYLFLEAGGFSTRNKPDWKSRLYVLKRTRA